MLTLSLYRQSVVDRAADPVKGIPAKVQFLNLAAIRKLLDDWAVEDYEERKRIESLNRVALPAPPENPEMQARIGEQLRALAKHIGSGFNPSTAASDGVTKQGGAA